MKKLSIFFLFVFALALAQAQIDVDNYSIQTDYIFSDTISGWMNLSFESEPLDSFFTDSEGNKISLEEFLNNSNYTYECSTNACLPDYTASLKEQTKIIKLNKSESKIIGFVLTGNIEQINSISFRIQSNAGVSESNQLKIDFLNDGEVETGNTKFSSQLASANYGCYNTTSPSETPVGYIPYCQAINLTEAPGFQIGAWLKKDMVGANGVQMQLYKDSQTPLESCTISNSAISTSGSSPSCSINYFVPKTDTYYVCVVADRGESTFFAHATDTKKCGFEGKPPRDFVASYEIFAKPKKFESVGTLTLTNTLPNQDSLNYLFEEYLLEKYGSLDCSEGCIIPVNISSSVDNQQITISNILVDYKKLGFSAQENSMYDLSIEASKITSDYQKINLDGIFKIKNSDKKRTYSLRFDGKEIIKEPIEVKNISFYLSPTVALAGSPTKFIVHSSTNDSFTEYSWDFGDNKTAKTTINSTTHSYEKIGNYTLTLTLKRLVGGEIKKEHNLTVSSPKVLIESNLELMKNTLAQINSEYSKLSPDEKALVDSKINVNELQSKISAIETKYKVTTSEDSYKDIVQEILTLDVPQKLIKLTTPEIPFFIKEEDISVEDIKKLGASNLVVSNQEVSDAVLYWNAQNLVITSSMSEIILSYQTGDETLIKKFILTIKPKPSVGEYTVFYNKYLLDFIGDGEKSGDSISYVTKSGTSKLEFLTTEDLTFTDLPISISPKVSELSLIGEISEAEKPKGWIIVIALIALALLGLLVYNILRRWYDLKYERYLFSDRNNLYNVMVYVNNSKKQGLENSEIRKNLSRAGWSSEQIRYIMRKFENKETGMPSLTLKKKTMELTHVKKGSHAENMNKNHTNLNK